MAGDICDCCGVFKTIGVASSTLGPISFAYCKRCLQFGAEPFWLVKGFVYEMCNGWDTVSPALKETLTVPIGPGIYIFADQII